MVGTGNTSSARDNVRDKGVLKPGLSVVVHLEELHAMCLCVAERGDWRRCTLPPPPPAPHSRVV